jgi:NAD(P)-dependent dehydrogenase (short-subunit alcohol dehydrogenase family)
MSATKTVLVTGSSSGIGRATAELFAARGWSVAATMRAPERAGALAATERVRVFRLDVTDPASIEQAVAAVVAEFGRIDVLVNNAGYGLIGAFEAMSEEQVRRQVETNFIGVMNVTRAVLPIMRAQKSGRIVNVASVASRLVLPLYTLYCATKHAVAGFSEALDFEVRPFGIRVKLIEPGAIKTEFFGRSLVMPETDASHPYDAYTRRVFANIKAACVGAPGPDIVAEKIWKAANDRPPWRMRYTPNGRTLLLGRTLAPGRLHAAVARFMLGA